MNEIALRVVAGDLMTSMKLSERSHAWLEEIARVMVQTANAALSDGAAPASEALHRLKLLAELSRFLAEDGVDLLARGRETFEREQLPAIVAALQGVRHD